MKTTVEQNQELHFIKQTSELHFLEPPYLITDRLRLENLIENVQQLQFHEKNMDITSSCSVIQS